MNEAVSSSESTKEFGALFTSDKSFCSSVKGVVTSLAIVARGHLPFDSGALQILKHHSLQQRNLGEDLLCWHLQAPRGRVSVGRPAYCWTAG